MNRKKAARILRADASPVETRKGRKQALRRAVRKHRQKLAGITAAAGVVAIVGGALVGVTGAEAATGGVGLGTYPDRTLGWFGTFNTGLGPMATCAERDKPYPTGQTTDIGPQNAAWLNQNLSAANGVHPALSGDQWAGINRVEHEYVDTTDQLWGAALFYATQAVEYPALAGTAFDHSNQGSLDAAINHDIYTRYGAAAVATVQAHAAALIQEINSTTAGSSTNLSGSFQFTVDASNNYAGTVTPTVNGAASGTIVLHNGVFDSTGTNTLQNATAGTAYAIHGVVPQVGQPADSSGTPYVDGGSYKIWADDGGTDWQGAGSGYAPELEVFTTPGGQTSIGAGPTATSTFAMSGEDPQSRSTTFLPVATSSAPSTSADGTLTDTFTFATTADGNGVNNPWHVKSDGTYTAVPFTVTAYQMSKAQAESGTIPADAVSLGTVSITTGTTGDTQQVTAHFPATQKPGTAITYVISYDAASASGSTKVWLPDNYSWSSHFAIASETTIVPMQVRLTSQIASPTAALSGTDDDTVTVEHSGFWLQDASGKQIDVPLVGQYVYYPAGTSASPTDDLPAGTQVLGTVHLTVTGDGNYKASTGGALPADPSAPSGTVGADGGHTSWRWAVDTAALAGTPHAGWVADSSEQYGVATQTATVGLPKVTTTAQPGVGSSGTATDTAHVTGTLPANGAQVAFTAYKVPTTPSSTGPSVVDAPVGTAPGDLSWVCTDANRVYTNVGSGQTITAPGDYNSPSGPTGTVGKILWVESLWTVPATGQQPQLLSQGTCGDTSETTYVVDVTTQAKTASGSQTANVGDKVFDTAQATGYVPEGGSISFDVYAWPKGQAPVCDKTTKLRTLATTAPITGGLYPAGSPLDAVSTDYTVPAQASGMNLGFVEVTKDQTGRIVAQGTCGDQTEVIPVSGPLVNTGGISPADATQWRTPITWLLVALGAGMFTAVGGSIAAGARAGRRPAA